MTRAQTDWHAGANHGENSPEDRSIFYLKPSAPRRAAHPPFAPCVARSAHLGGPAPAARYTYIDAFRGKTVTRETLLRYTVKSYYVNVLIRGNLLKTPVKDWPQVRAFLFIIFDLGFPWRPCSHMRLRPSPSAHASTGPALQSAHGRLAPSAR